ncbi:hypothetical protein ABTF44_20410, partial [Acinetobacter baumannii]
PSMVQYIANLEMRRHGKKVNLLFEAPGKSTMNIEEASLVPVQKDLSLKTPTGRYLRDDKWDNATLDFKALDGNQVQFVLVANHGANVGEASGT